MKYCPQPRQTQRLPVRRGAVMTGPRTPKPSQQAKPPRRSASIRYSHAPIGREEGIGPAGQQAKSTTFCKAVRAQGRKYEPAREYRRKKIDCPCCDESQSRWRPVAKGDNLVSIPVGAARLDVPSLTSRSAAWVAGAGGLCGFATFSAHGGLPSVSPHGLECTSLISCGQLLDRCACVNGRTFGPVSASR